jgi:hypothetical protein
VILIVAPVAAVALAVGDVIVETGGEVSVVVFAVSEPPFVTKQPAPSRIELTTASHVRIPKAFI